MPDYGSELEFGAFVTPSSGRPEVVLELVRTVEHEGLDLVTFQDHPYQPAFLDTWTLLSFVAARTERVRLAPNVMNLPLRLPSVVARAAASLDLLSGGRVELGLGAGAFWDGIEAMGVERLSPGQSVDALEEAIEVIRSLWDVETGRGARIEGEYHRLSGAKRGPAPASPIGIWIGAYKPRMLALTGRVADGWIPSLSYLEPGQPASGNERIDEAAAAAGRDPGEIRRLLNVFGSIGSSGGGGDAGISGPPEEWVERLVRYALEDGIGTFILGSDEPRELSVFAAEIAPAVREQVEAERGSGGRGTDRGGPDGSGPDGGSGPSGNDLPGSLRSAAGAEVGSTVVAPEGPAGDAGEVEDRAEYERLGIAPTPEPEELHSGSLPWDDASRPRRPRSGPGTAYTERGRAAGKHLIDVHDGLRRELSELREVVAQVREGAISAGEARSELNAMAMRQNDWTLGAFCARYCRAVAAHHTLEDEAVFPHLARSDDSLEPVIDRLHAEHLVIHDAIEAVDEALVNHINDPSNFERLQGSVDYLTDTLLSHLSYEEVELVEPISRLGLHPGQL